MKPRFQVCITGESQERMPSSRKKHRYRHTLRSFARISRIGAGPPAAAPPAPIQRIQADLR
eukprot:7633210-Pyramimonas_sp.AAC.1